MASELSGLAPADTPSAEMPEQERLQDRLQDRFGVTLKQKSGQMEISVNSAYETKLLFDVPSKRFLKDAAQIEERLSLIALVEEQRLSTAYKVRFSSDGQDLGRPLDPDTLRKSNDNEEPDVRARAPRLDELAAARFAFQKSFPKGRRGKPIEIEFLDTPAILDDHSVASFTFEKNGSFILDKDGRLISPDAQPIMFINPRVEGSPESPLQMRGTLEYDMIHELAHGTQYRLGVTQLTTTPNGSQMKRTDASTRYANALGFRDRPDGREFLAGHGGRFYMSIGGTFSWERVNASGEPVDAKGRVTTEDKGASVPNAAVRSDALVRPATEYFPNCDEEIAEGLDLFRFSRSSRGQLRNNDPVLYGIAESLDNADLAAASGGKGEPVHWIRTPDGNIVRNTAEKLEQIILFDKGSK